MTSKGRSIWPPMIWIARYIDSSTSCTVTSTAISRVKHTKRFGLLTVLKVVESRGISSCAWVVWRHNEGKEPASKAASWSRASQGGSYIYRTSQQTVRAGRLYIKNPMAIHWQTTTTNLRIIQWRLIFIALETKIELLSWFDLQRRKINGIDLHSRHQLRMATLCAAARRFCRVGGDV